MPNQDNQKSRGSGRISRRFNAPLSNLTSRNLYRHLLGASLASLAVFILGFVLLPALISEASATNLVGVGANWAAISLTLDPDYEATQGGESPSLSTHGNVDFGEITPTAKASGVTNSSAGNVGTLEILKKTIRIDTTGNYYQVFLSMNNDDSNALKNTTNSYITVPAISSDGTNTGTWSSPAYFSAQGWGYAVTGDTEAITLPTFFTASPASIASSLGNELTYANDEAVYSGVKFSAVPLLSNPQQIYKNTTNVVGGFADNNADTFNVYYGVMVNTDVLAGTYNNQIVYTALASAANLDEVSTNVYVEKYIIADGVEQEISFDLAASTIPSNITTSNTHVYLVPHSEMLAAGEDGYDIAELAGYANPASSYSECEITNLNITASKGTIHCNSPQSSNGTADDLTNSANGMYDYWINITGLNFNYISKTPDESETVAYIGLQTTYEEENETTGETETKNHVAEMQEMSGAICKNTNMWGTGTGSNARIYDNLGEDGNNPLLAANTDMIGVSSFLLTDNRDSKPYLVRRLADENCWMVQNLDLDLVAVANGAIVLDKLNTDLNSKNAWAPDAETIDDNASQSTETTARTYENGLKYGDSDGSLAYYIDSEFLIEHASHYLGDFYNWYAATAESGTAEMTNQKAVDSICPFGWQLPLFDASNSSASKTFSGITTAYGISSGTGVADESAKMRTLPIALYRYGYLRFNAAGEPYVTNVEDGPLWGAYSVNKRTARALGYNTDSVIPNHTESKYIGFPVRCAARD